MGKLILVLGGARSGKSAVSEAKVSELADEIVYIATMEPNDEELKERVKRHKKMRPAEWKTVEEPLLVQEAVQRESKSGVAILIDCLTLFVSNCMMKNMSEDEIVIKVKKLALECKRSKVDVVIVSNEVGMGVVPPSESGRAFRDIQGFANQAVAKAADEVYFTIAGIPINIKPNASIGAAKNAEGG